MFKLEPVRSFLQVRSDISALKLMKKVIGEANKTWKFLLAISGVLTNAALTNKTKGIQNFTENECTGWRSSQLC